MTKQARTLTDQRYAQAVSILGDDPRGRLMLALSAKAGLRAVEIAGLMWDRVDLEERQLLLKTTKGDKPRTIPMTDDVYNAFRAYEEAEGRRHLWVFTNAQARPGEPLTRNSVAVWFRDLYVRRLGWTGYSSHSGRRTFCTNVARKIVTVGGSLKDVQDLMGHENLGTTQKYIDKNPEAQRKVMELI